MYGSRRRNFMNRWFVAAAIALCSTSAFSLQSAVEKGTKLGTGCVGSVRAVAPKLGTCTIVGSKTRIWCPNGEIFDSDEDKAPIPLVRSLCNLTQIP
jgi:hypothetical protein